MSSAAMIEHLAVKVCGTGEVSTARARAAGVVSSIAKAASSESCPKPAAAPTDSARPGQPADEPLAALVAEVREPVGEHQERARVRELLHRGGCWPPRVVVGVLDQLKRGCGAGRLAR
jgi:hypothetical protein